MGDRERAGPQVLLSRGIRSDWTKIESRLETLSEAGTDGKRTGCTLCLFYLGCSGT